MNTNIKDLNQLHAMVEMLIREHGNLPVSVSVLQEPGKSEFEMHWEDRPLCSNIEVVELDGRKFVELAV